MPVPPDQQVTPPFGCDDLCLWEAIPQDAEAISVDVPGTQDAQALSPLLTFNELHHATPLGRLLSVYGFLELSATSSVNGTPTVCSATGGVGAEQTWCQNIHTHWVSNGVFSACAPRAATFTTIALGRARVEAGAMAASSCGGTACVNSQGAAVLELSGGYGVIGAFVLGCNDAYVRGQATHDTTQVEPKRWRYQSSDCDPPPPFWHTVSGVSRGSRSAQFSVTIVQLVCTHLPPAFEVTGSVGMSSTIQAGERGWILAEAELTHASVEASCGCDAAPGAIEPAIIYP